MSVYLVGEFELPTNKHIHNKESDKYCIYDHIFARPLAMICECVM